MQAGIDARKRGKMRLHKKKSGFFVDYLGHFVSMIVIELEDDERSLRKTKWRPGA
jgi:hypothetical protein